MTSRSAARALVALLAISCLSGLVVANDAGTGGDAGSSISTAAWLPAANATYYGNLTASNDTNDYYGVNMSSDGRCDIPFWGRFRPDAVHLIREHDRLKLLDFEL